MDQTLTYVIAILSVDKTHKVVPQILDQIYVTNQMRVTLKQEKIES